MSGETPPGQFFRKSEAKNLKRKDFSKKSKAKNLLSSWFSQKVRCKMPRYMGA